MWGGGLVGLMFSQFLLVPPSHDNLLDGFILLWMWPAIRVRIFGAIVFGAILGILIGIWIPKIVIVVTVVISAAFITLSFLLRTN